MNTLKLEYKWLVGIVYVLALFMDLLDMTVTNVAIPTLAKEFSATTTTIEWVLRLLPAWRCSSRSPAGSVTVGTKRVRVALSIFTAGSLLCGSWESNRSSPSECCKASVAACSRPWA
jgi:MFS family permease